jgi:hypothetical protein
MIINRITRTSPTQAKLHCANPACDHGLHVHHAPVDDVDVRQARMAETSGYVFIPLGCARIASDDPEQVPKIVRSAQGLTSGTDPVLRHTKCVAVRTGVLMLGLDVAELRLAAPAIFALASARAWRVSDEKTPAGGQWACTHGCAGQAVEQADQRAQESAQGEQR